MLFSLRPVCGCSTTSGDQFYISVETPNNWGFPHSLSTVVTLTNSINSNRMQDDFQLRIFPKVFHSSRTMCGVRLEDIDGLDADVGFD